ncbi:hypothetical protein PEC18_39800 [Paucibacter sp. O1-1]|nr:hypothetical protein [Paucibacter sp. O1-1]MDA3831754.1 hypothetical protein [Paucibacter sp. O1-1]
MAFVATLGEVYAHIDLHETTDTDELEFRPLLSARDGVEYDKGVIPDGFYLAGDSDNPTPEFQKAIIDAVAKVTHIAPDDDGQLIEVPIEQFGVINYPVKNSACAQGSPTIISIPPQKCIQTAHMSRRNNVTMHKWLPLRAA